MTKLSQWAQRHNVADHAVADLRRILGMQPDESDIKFGDFHSEAGVQSAVRLEAAQKNILLFRNNVGAFESENGRWVRYGLANDSPQMNSKIKSGDLIGVPCANHGKTYRAYNRAVCITRNKSAGVEIYRHGERTGTTTLG